MFALGSRLASFRPLDIDAHAIFTATLDTEITLITVTSVTSTGEFRLHHAAVGEANTLDNALFYNISVASPDNFTFSAGSPGAGIQLEVGETIYFRCSVAGALTVNVYGITETLAKSVRGY